MRPDPAKTDYAERLRRVDVPSVLRPLMLEAADEIERLTARLATVEAAVTSTAGDAERSEFHRGWSSCCKMVAAAMRPRDEQ